MRVPVGRKSTKFWPTWTGNWLDQYMKKKILKIWFFWSLKKKIPVTNNVHAYYKTVVGGGANEAINLECKGTQEDCAHGGPQSVQRQGVLEVGSKARRRGGRRWRNPGGGGDATGRSWGDTLRGHHVGKGAHGSIMGTGRGTSFHGGSWREAAIGPGGCLPGRASMAANVSRGRTKAYVIIGKGDLWRVVDIAEDHMTTC